VNIMNVKQLILELFKQSAAPGVPVSLRKARENKTKLLVGLLMVVIFGPFQPWRRRKMNWGS